MSAAARGPEGLKGWHVAAMFVGGFAVIVGVNVALAVSAVRTFPGVEVANSYVASQTFDADRRAQDALGWTVAAVAADGRLRLSVAGPDGAPVRPRSLSARLGRATNVRQDSVPDFAWDGAAFAAPAALAPGNWTLRVEAVAADGTVFRRVLRLWVAE